MILCFEIAGKLVTVHGTVVKVSTVKPLVTQMAFDCTKCKTSITREFTDGKFSPPQNCDFQGCKSRIFTPIRSSAQTIDFQKIRCSPILRLMTSCPSFLLVMYLATVNQLFNCFLGCRSCKSLKTMKKDEYPEL